KPIEVDVKDTEVFPSGKAYIFHDFAALLPFSLLYEQDNYPALPGFIYAWADALERRDESLFKTLAGSPGGVFGGGSAGMQIAVFCNDGDIQAQTLANGLDRAAYPVFGSVLGSAEENEHDRLQCFELGMPMRPSSDYAAVETDIPALIIEGDMDPITPPPNAKAILPGFSNGTYIEFPYAGHGPTRSVQCAGHMLNRWYDDPTAEPDMSCPESMEEPDMWAPMFVTGFVPRLGAIFFEDKKKLAGPGAWGGLSIVVSLIAFLMLSLAPLGRKMNSNAPANVGKARFWAWLTATSSVAAVAVLGAAFAATAEASQLAILFGLVPWAKYSAWLGLFAGVFGIITIVAAIRGKGRHQIPTGSMLGFILTGIAALGLSSFMYFWDLAPF
ncbi:MAG: alpha/beta hydrolase, partial [Candidatus Tectomicrobia bacterium]|nr:alpha/beta hydrolase [Candidatus Tectomicrobia bacterium]